MRGSSSNTIGFNTFENNKVGVFLQGSNNTLTGNDIIGHEWDGVVLYYGSSDNHLFNNYLANNHVGIEVYEGPTPDNMFYHNSFVDNFVHVTPTSSGIWDNGYPSGGNYWRGYAGIDLNKGMYQNESGSDGLGDVPVVINEDNRDNYPLMKPYSGSHDIGITDLHASKTIVGQGYSTKMNLVIINYGEETETFNVTVKADSIVIRLEIMALTARSSAILTFEFNTTYFAYGNYVIVAEVDNVTGEIDKNDNTRQLTAPIHVGVSGDVTSATPDVYDGRVDIRDVTALILKFNAKPGDSLWHPNYDVNDDGVINIRDITIAILHFYQHE
jgi:parallel beta-helix repeat protein